MPSMLRPRVSASALYRPIRSSPSRNHRERGFHRDHDGWFRHLYNTRTCSSPRFWRGQHSAEEEHRPLGISYIDWMLLQHSRLWRRYLSASSYKAFFGPCNERLRASGVRQSGRAWEWNGPAVARWVREAQKRGFSEDAETPTRVGFGDYAEPAPKESPGTEYPKKIELTDEDELTIGPRYEAWERDNIAFTAPYKSWPYKTLGPERTECKPKSGAPSRVTPATDQASSTAPPVSICDQVDDKPKNDGLNKQQSTPEDKRHDDLIRHVQDEHPEYFEGPVEQLSTEQDKMEYNTLAGMQEKMNKPYNPSCDEFTSSSGEKDADQLNGRECNRDEDLDLLSAEEIRSNMRRRMAASERLCPEMSECESTKDAAQEAAAPTKAVEPSQEVEEIQLEQSHETVTSGQTTSTTEEVTSTSPSNPAPPSENAEERSSEPERSLGFMPRTSDVNSGNIDSNIAKTTYRTFIYEPSRDSITEIVTESPWTSNPAIPLHAAFSRLNNPARFLQHISGFLEPRDEIISAQGNILVIRERSSDSRAVERITAISDHQLPRFNDGSDASGSEKAPATATVERAVDSEAVDSTSEGPRYAINPVDGTMAVSLSPTGYAGVDPTVEAANDPYADEDGSLRRAYWDKAREEQNLKEGRETEKSGQRRRERGREWWTTEGEEGEKRTKGRGRTAGVVKTVVWAGTICYVAGVVAELLR
ncbi:uncharacterized protein EI97DRAFT_467871 [Westerdykella ornata]|uniref:Uncharacterized protein n=1 Tax=Westerdykella ornata TaxID=318751 RepID=A0A6A6JLE0_WESOR|nr:uncharacterized protein EI97DRAFT_467871 [Westerdykella ornata]KAF2275729.1 hypothetical protein EI97DRAFT_467871 [Westerdykella ornata]